MRDLAAGIEIRRSEAGFWDVDLGASHYVERLTLSLEPAEGEVVVDAYAYPTPWNEVPVGAWRHRGTTPQIAVGEVARHLRIWWRGQLRGVEAMGVELFGDSLLATWQQAFSLFPERPLFATSEEGFSRWTGYAEVWERARALARGLRQRVEGRAFVAICAENSASWAIADIAAVLLGWVVVPLSPQDPDDRLVEIVGRCGCRVVIGEASRWKRLAGRCPKIELVVESADLEAHASSGDFSPVAVEGDALYSLLFTSGSTGTPKGAMRSYDAFNHMLQSYGVVQPAVHLSHQPLSHLSERMMLPTVMVHGGRVGFSRGGAHMFEELALLRPTFVFSVPRLYEVLHARYRDRPQAARKAFGDRLQSVGVGSAPIGDEVLAFLRSTFADIWVTEGYGSTECGTIAVNGTISADVDVRLEPVRELGYDPDGDPPRGEILVKTPHLVSGYFGDEEATAKSFDADGYFRTGDVGERAADGTVHVIGRVKNTVKLAQGEFVCPDRLEVVLGDCEVVDQIFVHADATAAVVSAAVVSRDAGEEEVRAALRKRGKEAGLAAWEIPTRVLLLAEPMSVENGLLTASGKLKRRVAAERFGPLLALDPDAPLEGVDSLTAAELVSTVGAPLQAWFGARTLRDLVSGASKSRDPAHDEDLAREVTISPAALAPTPPRVVFLTGATGFLGRHLLEALLERTEANVICLVRGDTARVAAGERVEVVSGDLAEPRLGLQDRDWERLAEEVDAIVHGGAIVSWLAPYAELRAANVAGTCAVIDLAAAERHKALHFVSTISCAPADGDESTALSRAQAERASPYAMSKWIAERHVARAHAAGLPGAIYRPAMIAGHSERGEMNAGDYIHRYLEACLRTGLCLDVDQVLDMTPVDYVAHGISALTAEGARGVFHLANIGGSRTYAELAAMLACEAVDYERFRETISHGETSLRALAGYFPAEGFSLHMGPWPDSATRERLREMGIRCPVIDRAIIARYVERLRADGTVA